ncbi:unnamed protein product, partial [Polarella glacialis]
MVAQRRLREVKYDVVAKAGDLEGEGCSEELATKIVECLALKNFCLIGLGNSPGQQRLVEDACNETLELLGDRDGSPFAPPPSMVVDGLLGEEGSAEIFELGPAAQGAVARRPTPGLVCADRALTELANELASLDDLLGCQLDSRSPATLHSAGIPLDENAADLTEVACQKWLNILGQHRLMLVLFLGPGVGRLELGPLQVGEGSEEETCEVDVEPGTLGVLRVDALSHRYFTTTHSTAISCFLLEDATAGRRGRRGMPSVLTPTCQELMRWATSRLGELRMKQAAEEELEEDASVPAEWRRVATRMFQVGPQVAIRGTSCKFPGSYSDVGFWSGMMGGSDLVEEVPMTRWDHSEVFDDNPESWKFGKTNCMHGSFIDGVDLFDCKFFSISVVESRSMDPAQRHILETAYE